MIARFNAALLVALVLDRIATDTGQRFEAVALAILGFGAWAVLDGRRLRRKPEEDR